MRMGLLLCERTQQIFVIRSYKFAFSFVLCLSGGHMIFQASMYNKVSVL